MFDLGLGGVQRWELLSSREGVVTVRRANRRAFRLCSSFNGEPFRAFLRKREQLRAYEKEGVTVQRTKQSQAAVVMTGLLLGLGWGVSGGAATASAAPSDQLSQMTIEGTLPPVAVTGRFASCLGDGYVERGSNQTVPRLRVLVDSTVSVGPVVAWGTEPNAFGSRAVTSMTFSIQSFDTSRDQRWQVTYYCTTDKNKAWLVLG
jgi:hypothetical protein